MPIAASDLELYWAANRPDDDTSTVGGAIDVAARPVFTQFTAAAVAEALSDGADTRTLTIEGRDAAGNIVSEGNALNGTTPVAWTQSYERVLKATLGSSDGSRTVSIRQGVSGTVRITLNPDETEIAAVFRKSASESGIAIRYEKLFYRNNHGSLDLQSAEVTLTADPDSRIRIGLAPSKDDSATATNRKTTPASVTFVDDSVAQSVPTGSLGSGEGIGVWVEQNLPADDSPHNTTFTVQLDGTTV